MIYAGLLSCIVAVKQDGSGNMMGSVVTRPIIFCCNPSVYETGGSDDQLLPYNMGGSDISNAGTRLEYKQQNV